MGLDTRHYWCHPTRSCHLRPRFRCTGNLTADRSTGAGHRRKCPRRVGEGSLLTLGYIFDTAHTTEMIKLHPYSRPPLAATYCSKACCCNPVGSSVGSHTEYTVLDCGVVHPLLFSDTCPFAINPEEPDVVDIGHPVIVNVKLADFWG
jgi:hypothetical protein